MGRKLVLTGTKLTNLAAPKLATIDTILPDQGALMLLDPANPVTPWPTFDLNSANYAGIPNLAYAQAKALIPAGTATSLGVSYQKHAGFENDGVKGRIERSGKGGLHVQYSQSVGTEGSNTRVMNIYGGADINAYLLANKAHSFYFAYWGKVTRANSSAPVGGAQTHSSVNGNNNFNMFYIRAGAGETNYPTDAKRIAWYAENVTNMAGKLDQNIFQDMAISDASAATTTAQRPFFASPIGTTTAEQIKTASHLFYGYYLEDLTVSGRSYATVNALVQAKYNKDVKTAGGRYYGDTYSAPLA